MSKTGPACPHRAIQRRTDPLRLATPLSAAHVTLPRPTLSAPNLAAESPPAHRARHLVSTAATRPVCLGPSHSPPVVTALAAPSAVRRAMVFGCDRRPIPDSAPALLEAPSATAQGFHVRRPTSTRQHRRTESVCPTWRDPRQWRQRFRGRPRRRRVRFPRRPRLQPARHASIQHHHDFSDKQPEPSAPPRFGNASPPSDNPLTFRPIDTPPRKDDVAVTLDPDATSRPIGLRPNGSGVPAPGVGDPVPPVPSRRFSRTTRNLAPP